MAWRAAKSEDILSVGPNTANTANYNFGPETNS
jgi:hypothetical protein